jgi:GMP reductase
MKDFLFSYDNVYSRPKYSELRSRDDADTSVEFLGKRWKLPIVPANMQDVISFENAKWLSENGYFYIMHRFDNANEGFLNYIAENYNSFKDNISISLGVNDQSKKELELYIKATEISNNCNYIPNFICIDVAHAHHKNVQNIIFFIKSNLPKTKIIVGNIATAEGYKYLYDLKVDAIKVGIAGGRICSTKFKTGFHLPTLHSVYECVSLGLDVPIIADGGIKYNGDIVKALVFGADMIMAGGLFASCIDSPAKITKDGKKIYRGSTSYESKGNYSHIEGITIQLDGDITYKDRMKEIKEDLSSAISYAGGKDLSAFNNVEWHLIL